MISRSRALELRREFASDDGPVDVDRVAKDLGCLLSGPRVSRTRGVVEASLRPRVSVDRFVLEVNPVPRHGWGNLAAAGRRNLARHRRRFRIAHELGHIWFFERRTGRGPRRKQPWTEREERWCDDFARTLLVPEGIAKSVPGTADSVFDLQARFDVSLEVAARAMAAAQPNLDVALWYWNAEDDPGPRALVHQWSNRLALPALRNWRDGTLVKQAMSEGEARGPSADLRGRAGLLRGAARSDAHRRQLVMVGGPA